MPQDPWAVVKTEDAASNDPWAVVSSQPANQKVPQQILDTLAARSANPTQFEQQRDPNNQPGILSSAASEIGNFVSSVPSMIGGLANPLKTGMKQAAGIAVNDQLRKLHGNSVPYRAAVALGTPLGVNATGMEQQADVGNTRGVIGTAIGDAAPYVAPYAAAKGISAISEALPSTARAGEAFQNVSRAVGDQPVNVGAAGDVALQAKDLASRGYSMPKVLRDFVNRVTDPTKGPLTFDEARDFQSAASRLSSAEYQRLTPKMQRQVAMFADEMGKATQATADSGGVGQDFSGAMKEYGQAANNAKTYQGLKDALVKKVIPGSIAGYALDRILSNRR